MTNETKKMIPVAEPDLSGNEVAYVTDAIRNDRVSSSGKYLDRFESEVAAHCGRKLALATSNGTTALHLALMALGVGPGDEVIVPSFTFASSAAVVVHAGAIPVFADSKADDWNLDPAQLDSLVTPRTKALMAVDIYGAPAAYGKIEAWCEKRNIALVEDSAESLGAELNGRKAGSFGTVSCFSFYGNKNITTGEGGMCLTDDADLYEKMRILKNHGMKQAGLYDHEVVGYNYRLTNIQAAVGCAQFERFPEFLAKRAAHEELYRSLLSNVPGIEFQKLPQGATSAHWLVSLLVPADVEKVRAALKEKGIDTRRLFKPVHLQPAFKKYAKGALPVSERLYEQGLSLPSSPLLTDDDIRFVCKMLLFALNVTSSTNHELFLGQRV